MDGTQQAERRRREHGASLVEFAIIMPVLFMLILGMISGGLTLSRDNSVQNAVREATRFGAVHPNPGTDTYLADVLAQVERAATGDLDVGVDERYICVAFIDDTDSDPAERVKRRLDTSSSTRAVGECFADGRTNEARVQVLAQRGSEIEGVFWSIDVDLESRSATRYERS